MLHFSTMALFISYLLYPPRPSDNDEVILRLTEYTVHIFFLLRLIKHNSRIRVGKKITLYSPLKKCF